MGHDPRSVKSSIMLFKLTNYKKVRKKIICNKNKNISIYFKEKLEDKIIEIKLKSIISA